jgi:hypothetical protein
LGKGEQAAERNTAREEALERQKMALTEEAWLHYSNPSRMKRLKWVEEHWTPRKMRLFSVACSRAVWDVIDHPQLRRAVEVTERYADGKATAKQLAAAREAASKVKDAWDEEAEKKGSYYRVHAAQAVWFGAGQEPSFDAVAPVNLQCALIRDLLGSPFRPTPKIDPAWLKWNRGAVPKLARSIYEERRFEEMSILPDALEEAGCTNTDLLEHCRADKPHARGCWVVDLILGIK